MITSQAGLHKKSIPCIYMYILIKSLCFIKPVENIGMQFLSKVKQLADGQEGKKELNISYE